MDGLLPIGTVVLLTNSSKRVMIIGFAQVTPDEPEKVWDYVGCAYPEGFLGPDATYVFNRDQIERVYAVGYQDEEQFAFKVQIDEALNKLRANS